MSLAEHIHDGHASHSHNPVQADHIHDKIQPTAEEATYDLVINQLIAESAASTLFLENHDSAP